MIPVDILALREVTKTCAPALSSLWQEHKGGMERPLDYYRSMVIIAAQFAATGAADETGAELCGGGVFEAGYGVR